MSAHLDFVITPQPDGTACGPACLQGVYRYYGDEVSCDQVVREVQRLDNGGTLTVFLGLHALRRGYNATIYTCDLQIFDPSWFEQDDVAFLRQRLVAQRDTKKSGKLRLATETYLDFLDLGGKVYAKDITAPLIRRILNQGFPIITGLSATWLYRCKRERDEDMEPDDVAGEPVGHFVVIHGLVPSTRRAKIADPNLHMPYPASHQYEVRVERLIGAILLGIVTLDATLLVVTPSQRAKEANHADPDGRQQP